MIFESADSLKISLHVITAIATPLHILGTYCILFKTPKTMGSVKWIMLNLHIWSMILDYGFTVLVVPVLTLPAIAGYTLGILRYWFGVPTFYQVCLVLSLVFIPAILTTPDQKTALAYIYEQIPNLLPEIRAAPIFVFALEYRYILIPYMFVITTVSTESAVLIVLIYWNMNAMARKSTQSGKTVKMQKKFLNAIYAQAIVFLVNLLAPIIYLLFSIFSNYYNQEGNNLVIIVSALHGISSTSIMIWAHKPYREVCLNVFSKGSAVATTTVSVVLPEETRTRNFARILS